MIAGVLRKTFTRHRHASEVVLTTHHRARKTYDAASDGRMCRGWVDADESDDCLRLLRRERMYGA